MLTRKAKLFLSLAAATPLLFAACHDNTLTGPYGDVAGTYQLTVFQNATPPVTYSYSAGQIDALPNGGTLTWTDGTMVLNSNGTFTETNNYEVTPTGGQTQGDAFVSVGTFTVNGTEIDFSAPPQNQASARFFTGTIVSDRINYIEADGGVNFAYEYRR
jgi:hypothetical protein